MKKIRKIVALALATVMMMAMSITAFAAETQSKTIQITNLKAGEAAVFYAQIIKADTTKTSGWSFVNEDVEKAFLEAVNGENSSVDGQTTLKNFAENKIAESTVSEALKAVKDIVSFSQSDSDTSFTVSEAGYYVVKFEAKNSTNPAAQKYVYSLAGIGVLQSDFESSDNLTMVAKRSPDQVFKKVDDTTYVETSRILTYTVEADVPYIFDGQTNPQFKVYDKLTGAKMQDVANGKIELSVKVGDGQPTTMYGDYAVDSQQRETFVLDLTELLKDNANAFKTVTIVYKAEVIDVEVNNISYPGYGENDPEPDVKYVPVKSYSGTLKLIKNDVKDTEKKLPGAKFILLNADETAIAKVDATGKITAWETYDKTADNTSYYLTTDANGEINVAGLDKDVEYVLYEKEAPTGYTLDETAHKVTAADWDTTIAADAVQKATITVSDTTLIRLPFTGGMGTTIFTVLGVAIMVMASALYFATKKKATK